jgi:serine/threonine-protein kinase RsbW
MGIMLLQEGNRTERVGRAVAQRSTHTQHAGVSLRVPFAPSSVGVARQTLKRWMRERGSSANSIEDARVVISELVGNSIRHASPLPDGSLMVTWKTDSTGLQLSVTDGGSESRPRKVHAPTSAVAGRGMTIVDTLSVSWWTETSPSRTTVHALIPPG